MENISINSNEGRYLFRNMNPYGIIEKACAFSAVNAVAAATELDWDKVYASLFRQVHEFCLMADNKRCIYAMIKEHDFFRKPIKKRIYTVNGVLAYMNENCRCGETAIVKTAACGYGGHMTALIPIRDSESGKSIYTAVDTEDRRFYYVEELWLCRPDGRHHSPAKDKTGKENKVRGRCSLPSDHSCFHYFQANPANRFIGDCVVRGIAAACGITWHEAIDRLSGYGHTMVNNRYVYPKMLKDEGFIKCPALLQNKKQLPGEEFCKIMDNIYHRGEHIAAQVGRSHIAAVLPIMESDGTTHYKIIDNWDSSDRKIGEYWVKPVYKGKDDGPNTKMSVQKKLQKETELPVQIKPKKETEMSIRPGIQIDHPKFGKGTILQVNRDKSNPILEVDFPSVGVKKMASAWILKNCSF